jgi:integrase
MRRKRFQKGSLQCRKHGRHRMWVAAWWEDGGRRSKVLGRCSQMGKGEAEQVLSNILRPINAGVANGPRPVHTFKQFVEDVYLPFARRGWKKSTETTTEKSIQCYLVKEFGTDILHSITRDRLQDFLEKKALDLSASPVTHIRWNLNAIFKLAVSDGAVLNNPAAELKVPKNCKEGWGNRTLTREEAKQYLEVFPLREKLIARLALIEGMRPGEIMALRWKSVQGGRIGVEQRVYDGVLDTPKNGKIREGGMSDVTVKLMEEWVLLARDRSPEAFVFASENLASPLSPQNVWRRNMKPKLDAIGLGWATFQVLRRTNSTLSKKLGVDPKVAADQRGHGLGVSMAVYTISDLAQKRAAVNQLEVALSE